MIAIVKRACRRIALITAGFLAFGSTLDAAAATVEYVHTDALGSVVAITNSAGQPIGQRREYEPYGRQLQPAAIVDGPGYTGHVMDAATGLVQMQQRYYDPLLGIFYSVDPVTALSNPLTLFNRYRYANGNPYKFFDPDGRLGCTGTRIQSVCDSGGVAAMRTSARSPLDTGRNAQSGAPRGSLVNSPTSKSAGNSTGSGASFKAPGSESVQARGLSASSIFTGDKTISFTGVAALGMGLKAEKLTGPDNDKISFVTPALGLSAAATVNLATIRYDWGGAKTSLDAGLSGGGVRGGLGLAGGLQVNLDPHGIELQVSGGGGGGASFDLYGIGYKPGGN